MPDLFTFHYFFKVQPHGNMDQNLIPFEEYYCSTIHINRMLLIYLLMNCKIAAYFAIYCSPAMTEHHERK